MTSHRTLRFVLRYAFDTASKRRLTEEDFVRIHAFDRRWLSPGHVRRAVAAGVRSGLLAPSGEDAFEPGFDLEEIRVPFDWAPEAEALSADVEAAGDVKEPAEAVPLFRRIVRRVASQTSQSDAEVVAASNEQQAAMGGLVTAEVAALIYARLQDVEVDAFLKEALEGLRAKGT